MGNDLCIARRSQEALTINVNGDSELIRLRAENAELKQQLHSTSGYKGPTVFFDTNSDGTVSPMSSKIRPSFLTSATDVSSGDSYDWLNALLAAMWPSVTDYVEAVLKEQIEATIKEKVPFPLVFNDLDFGKEPLRLEKVHVKKFQAVAKDGAIGNLFLSMNLNYCGDSNISMSLPAGVNVGVSKIHVVGGPLILELSHLLPAPPFFSGIQVYFTNPPKVDLSWTGIAGMIDATRGETGGKTTDKSANTEKEAGGMLSALDPTSVLRSWLQDTIESALMSNVVRPNRVAVIMNTEISPYDIKIPFPSSILQFQILQGKNLPAGDWTITGGSSDAYCIVQIGGEKWTSTCIKSSLNPVWKNEYHDFYMDDHATATTNVMIDVYDQDFMPGGSPDFLGRVQIPLSAVLNAPTPRWYPMVIPQRLGGPLGPKNKPSELLLGATMLPVVLDHALAQKVPKSSKKPVYLLCCGIQQVTHIHYDPLPPAKKQTPPLPDRMTIQVDTVFGKHQESTGECEVIKPEPIPAEDSEDEGAANPPPTNDVVHLQKASVSFQAAYVWPLTELSGQASITLKLNGKDVETVKFNVESLLKKGDLTDDSVLSLSTSADKERSAAHHPDNMSSHNMLHRRFQVRVIQRA